MDRLLDLSSTLAAVLIMCINADLASGTSTNEFSEVSNCICPGYSVQYECSINGNGFTLWNGTAFDCPLSGDEIILSHAKFSDGPVVRDCNDGNIVASIIQSSPFISRLNVSAFNSSLSGRTIQCVHDNTQTGNQLLIGTSTLMTSDPFSSPGDIQLAFVSPEQLTFSWSPSTFSCFGLSYRIESNCGICGNSSSTLFTTCFLNGSSTIDTTCSFAVATVICDDIVGNLSDPLNVTLRVPRHPNITNVKLRYNGLRGYLTAVDITFSQLDFFNITDGKDGSAIYHLVEYNYSTPSADCNQAGTFNISASSCTAGIYNVSFNPEQCLSSSAAIELHLFVSSSNILGSGLAKHIAIEYNNSYFDVKYDQTNKTITCTFHNELESSSIKSCSIVYGPCLLLDAQREEAVFLTTAEFPNIGSMEIPSDIQGYCYTATSNSTESLFTVELIDAVITSQYMESCPDVIKQSWNGTTIIILGVALAMSIIVLLAVCVTCAVLLKKKSHTSAGRPLQPPEPDKEDDNHMEPNDLSVDIRDEQRKQGKPPPESDESTAEEEKSLIQDHQEGKGESPFKGDELTTKPVNSQKNVQQRETEMLELGRAEEPQTGLSLQDPLKEQVLPQPEEETSLNEVNERENDNEEDSEEPVGRFDHFMVGVEAKCYMYGGQTDANAKTEYRLLEAIRVFDVHTKRWNTIWTKDYPREPLYEGACCSSPSGDIYTYGGQTNDAKYSNKLYHFSIKTGTWQLLNGDLLDHEQVPMKKLGCGMVIFRDQSRKYLAVIGGSGILQYTKQPESKFIKCTNHGWTNEFHVFDINNQRWKDEHYYRKHDVRPPPCSHFSFTAVSDKKALLFGGCRAITMYNHLYRFNFDQKEVKEIRPGGKLPLGRASHAACCLGYGEDYSALLVTGGIDADENTLNDAWIFSVSSQTWTKLEDSSLLQRCGHSATATKISQKEYKVTIFGGCPCYDRANPEKVMPRIARTYIMTFEYDTEWQLKGTHEL